MHKTWFVVLLSVSISACGVVYRGVSDGFDAISQSQIIRQGRHGKLTEQEVEWASVAWKYVENNTQLATGLVNSIDNYPTTNMAGIADYLITLLAAREFEFISNKQYDERLTLVLSFLNKMDLSYGIAPNKVYGTQSGMMVNYGNQPQDIGWSSLDVGRLLIVLAIVKQHSPEFTEYIDKAVLRWNFCELVSTDGELYGSVINDGQLIRYKEGRLGLEEYTSFGYLDWQLVPEKAMNIEPYDVATIYGVDLIFDGRDPRVFNVLRPVYSTPYLWMGLEFNWDKLNDDGSSDASHSNHTLSAMADAIYQVQELRWENERIYTARGEHVVSGEPYFVYDAIYGLGTPWITLAEDGSSHDHLALVSTRVAFQMWALWKTDYTERLMVLVKELYDPQRGWYEGRYELTSAYEKSISLKTNAGVLEALLYKQNGKLYQLGKTKEYRDVKFNSRFDHPGRCLVETFR
ncbi:MULTISPECIES: DUF3131 domain-containing protein [Vibrio]|uniref:DUF3131 domain-containing protein n=1 Tax=Vibrio rotiferianus TaxID=190895 RepID=A0A7Y3Z8E6_9VIBR|nr:MULTISPECIES: DUF3131 domain-containing protein [Vibrio]MDK9776028.1 DUF3131 domain-containing protein [Vibrio sp. D401a]MDK9805948.1 DUF3131 domain-containing protein [Vibrio sp. D406a]NOH47345.1 DUF3131 domain-containing protein [Vibrio rotiferianus]USD52191.1 DUF3131 domain-containing protein [Vibrio sp. SCSIO 43153]